MLKTNVIVSSKIYDYQDNFYIEIVNVPFLDGDVHFSSYYGVYMGLSVRKHVFGGL